MNVTCEHWDGAMALEALGALPDDERPGLRAHLDGCATCRATWQELATTARALSFVDDASIAPTASVPPMLTERVLGSLHRDARSARRQRIARMAASASIGAVAASLLAIVVLASTPGTPTSSHVEVLRPASGVGAATATAVLSAKPWGTAIQLTESGLPTGRVYEVSMRTSTGTWWPTGSYTAVRGDRVVVPMTCYAPMNSITAIRVTNASGAVVLETARPPGADW